MVSCADIEACSSNDSRYTQTQTRVARRLSSKSGPGPETAGLEDHYTLHSARGEWLALRYDREQALALGLALALALPLLARGTAVAPGSASQVHDKQMGVSNAPSARPIIQVDVLAAIVDQFQTSKLPRLTPGRAWPSSRPEQAFLPFALRSSLFARGTDPRPHRRVVSPTPS